MFPVSAQRGPQIPGLYQAREALSDKDLSPLADGTSSARTERALGARLKFRV